MAHLLKRLELAGFKSFAEKTSLEFPRGITAIVGPNGSGKSNVIDAIRWLLGEREARQLRGGKVEDLIFAGTPKRSRVGQASAALYFDNHNKFFPVDFEEVVVSRQVSRDGTNKYFLNKAEIRLKDLIDFFAAARLGSRGITVITQGSSDMFLRASPKERREMLEEVLGLKEYQLKRADAERKLHGAEENLSKAQALIQEILPHLRSLKRQTSRWERRGELQEELANLEAYFFGSQWKRLEEEEHEIAVRARSHEAEREGLLKKQNEAERQVKAVEETRPEDLRGIATLKEKIEALVEKRGDLQRELGKLEARIELGRGRGSAASPEREERFVAALHSVKDVLEQALRTEPEMLEAAVHDALQEVYTALDMVDEKREFRADDAEVEEELVKVRRVLEEIDAEVKSLRDDEKQFASGGEDLRAAFKNAYALLEEAREAFRRWEEKMRAFELERDRVTLRREELARQMEQAGRNADDFKGKEVPSPEGISLSDAERRMFRLRGDLAAMGDVDEAILKEAQETEARYQFLEKESKDLAKAKEDLRRLIKELSEKVTSEFERALHHINEEFQRFFEVMFGGGKARLIAMKEEREKKIPEDDPEEGEEISEEEDERGESPLGIEVQVSLPRKKINSLEVLSGGERSLVGIATVFALVSVSPPPFLVLDEIDAALDERNARRFSEMLREFSKQTQFVVVTHNRATMESADVLYGVTLNDDGTSKILSMKVE